MKPLKPLIRVAVVAAAVLNVSCSDSAEPVTERATERAARAIADAEPEFATTPQIRRALSGDLERAEFLLAALSDTIAIGLGPDLAQGLQEIRDEWRKYRGLQCDRLRAVFEQGTYAPVAELECLVYLTDSRRDFLESHYGFIEKVKTFRDTHDPARANGAGNGSGNGSGQ